MLDMLIDKGVCSALCLFWTFTGKKEAEMYVRGIFLHPVLCRVFVHMDTCFTISRGFFILSKSLSHHDCIRFWLSKKYLVAMMAGEKGGKYHMNRVHDTRFTVPGEPS